MSHGLAPAGALRIRLPFLWLGILSTLSVHGQSAYASPRIGALRPSVQIRDSWDRSLDLSTLGRTPVLLLYEDRDSSHQNDALKDELSALATGNAYRDRIALVAIADVADYDFWPARGFVQTALRHESWRLQTDIYCDWNGRVRRAIGASKGTSTVVLYGRDGDIVFAHEGSMPKTKRAELIELIRKELAPP
jgi:predicted transcriptional regulator